MKLVARMDSAPAEKLDQGKSGDVIFSDSELEALTRMIKKSKVKVSKTTMHHVGYHR